MLAHLRIMSVIEIFTSMNTTRVAEFANLPRTANNAEILELSETGLITESDRSTPGTRYWELTSKGMELMATYKRLLPAYSTIGLDTLKASGQEKCFRIIDSLKESEKTKNMLSDELDIANKEFDLYLTFLLRIGYVSIEESNNMIYYKLGPKVDK